MLKVYVALDGTEFSTKEAALEYQSSDDKFDEVTATMRKQFLVIKEAAEKAEEAVNDFQQHCIHEFVRLTPKSDTGNYDRSQDSYWYSIECKCCDYSWSEDQDKCTYDTQDPRVEIIRK